MYESICRNEWRGFKWFTRLNEVCFSIWKHWENVYANNFLRKTLFARWSLVSGCSLVDTALHVPLISTSFFNEIEKNDKLLSGWEIFHILNNVTLHLFCRGYIRKRNLKNTEPNYMDWKIKKKSKSETMCVACKNVLKTRRTFTFLTRPQLRTFHLHFHNYPVTLNQACSMKGVATCEGNSLTLYSCPPNCTSRWEILKWTQPTACL